MLKQRRKELNMTLKEMSQKIGLKYNTLSQYENNIQFPHATIIMDVAKAYELSDEEIIIWLKEINKIKKQG